MWREHCGHFITITKTIYKQLSGRQTRLIIVIVFVSSCCNFAQIITVHAGAAPNKGENHSNPCMATHDWRNSIINPVVKLQLVISAQSILHSHSLETAEVICGQKSCVCLFFLIKHDHSCNFYHLPVIIPILIYSRIELESNKVNFEILNTL